MLSVQFVKGEIREGSSWYIADFLLLDTNNKYLDRSGMCNSGNYNKYPRLRFSIIHVVRQYDLWKTFKILCHELAHAAIWLFHLPRHWSTAVDGGMQ